MGQFKRKVREKVFRCFRLEDSIQFNPDMNLRRTFTDKPTARWHTRKVPLGPRMATQPVQGVEDTGAQCRPG